MSELSALPATVGAAASPSHVNATSAARRMAVIRQHAALALVVVVLLVVGAWRLDRYPATWFDEGIYLTVSRNVVEHHQYFAQSADGTRDYSPVVGVGPTLLLPIALALRLGGMSLAVARIVPVLYLAAATALLFTVAKKLFGQRSALVTLVAACALPSLDWVATGRQALGETAALTFLLLGGLLALRAKTPLALVGAGATLGLAMVTKGQYTLILPTALVGIAIVDRLDGRARPLRWHATLLAAALAVYAAWIASLLLLMGAGHIMANVRLLRSASGGALIVLSPARMAAGFKLLLGPSSLLLVAPASLLALLPLRRATGDRRLGLTAIWVFEALWLGWFATASIAWPRYAFPGIALSTIFIGWLIPAAVDEARRRAGHVASAGAGRAVALAGVAAIALALGVGLWVELSPLARGDQRDPQRFAARLDATVPRGAVVDAWEPELGFLSNAALQYPPPGSLDKVVRDQWLGQTKPHDFSAGLTGQYLVVGPFARWVGAYDAALQSSHYALVTEVGGYALYQRVP